MRVLLSRQWSVNIFILHAERQNRCSKTDHCKLIFKYQCGLINHSGDQNIVIKRGLFLRKQTHYVVHIKQRYSIPHFKYQHTAYINSLITVIKWAKQDRL